MWKNYSGALFGVSLLRLVIPQHIFGGNNGPAKGQAEGSGLQGLESPLSQGGPPAQQGSGKVKEKIVQPGAGGHLGRIEG